MDCETDWLADAAKNDYDSIQVITSTNDAVYGRSRVEEFNSNMGAKAFSYSVSVRSSVTKKLAWSNGVGFRITETDPIPSRHYEIGKIYIHVTLTVPTGYDADLFHEGLTSRIHEVRVATAHISKEFSEIPALGYQRAGRHLEYIRVISETELTDMGGIVYVEDLDMLIGFEDQLSKVKHRNYRRNHRMALATENIEEAAAVRAFMYIDNEHNFGGFVWLNDGFDVFRVKTHRDPNLDSGLYLTMPDPMGGNQKVLDWRIYERISDKGPKRVFSTRQDAVDYGNPENTIRKMSAERERELTEAKVAIERQAAENKARLERELTEAKAKAEKDLADIKFKLSKDKLDYEAEKLKHDETRARHERIVEEMNHRYSELKHEREKAKIHEDTEAAKRKNRNDLFKHSSDIIKGVIGIITVSLSLTLLIGKAKAS